MVTFVQFAAHVLHAGFGITIPAGLRREATTRPGLLVVRRSNHTRAGNAIGKQGQHSPDGHNRQTLAPNGAFATLPHIPHTPEAVVVVPVLRLVPVAVRHTRVPRIVVPRTAAQHRSDHAPTYKTIAPEDVLPQAPSVSMFSMRDPRLHPIRYLSALNLTYPPCRAHEAI